MRGRATAAVAAVFVAAWLASAAAPAAAHSGARYCRGDISVPTQWDGVIRLTGTVVIRPGATVTVDAGTEVLVQPGTGADIVVRGRLIVRGLPGKPVVFDAAGGCGSGPWGGIVFEAGSAGIIENAAIRCSARGIAGDMTGVARTGVVVSPAPRGAKGPP